MQWYLENFDASDEDLLEALIERIKGPDFPTYGQIVGRRGIYRRLPDRARLDHHARGRQRGRGPARPYHAWSSPSCRTRSTRTTWRVKIDELAKDGRIAGIAAGPATRAAAGPASGW